MRIGLVVAGVILVVVGVVLLYVPLPPATTAAVPSSPGTPTFYRANITDDSLTGKVPVAVSWSSPVPVTVVGGVCSSPCTSVSDLGQLTVQDGTSGSFSLDPSNGASIFVGANTSTGSAGVVTFHLTFAQATLGSLLAVVGAIVLAVGVLLRRRKGTREVAMAQTSPPPAPGTETAAVAPVDRPTEPEPVPDGS